MSRYASETTVTAEQSRVDIERVLARYGAEAFAYSSEPRGASVGFRMSGRFVRFDLPLPDRNDPAFTHVNKGAVGVQPRTAVSAQKAWDQAARQRWRALLLIIKAKLEAVEAGVTTVEDEFLAHTVLPDGRTFGDYAKPEIDRIYIEGGMPTPLMLTGPKS